MNYKKDNIIDKMAKYTLKEGVILQPYGVNSKLTNDNLTDEIAELLIKKGRAKDSDFILTTKKKQKNNGNSK